MSLNLAQQLFFAGTVLLKCRNKHTHLFGFLGGTVGSRPPTHWKWTAVPLLRCRVCTSASHVLMQCMKWLSPLFHRSDMPAIPRQQNLVPGGRVGKSRTL